MFCLFQHSPRRNCEFIEKISNGHTLYQSVANHEWYLGFRKNGKPLKGYQWKGKKTFKCFQFQKTNYPNIRRTAHERPKFRPTQPRINEEVFGDFQRLFTELLTQKHDKT